MTVKELLSSPDKWCKGSYARHIDDSICLVQSNEACKFCLVGAIMRSYYNSTEDQAIAFQKVAKIIGKLHELTTWNDMPERTYEEVMEVVTKAGI